MYAHGDTISKSVVNDRIWEEKELTRILRILIRNPRLSMIDIGANIGGYTMFTAGALDRLTFAIDCYIGNIERIARAVQIEHVQNRIILIHNALYSSSGVSMIVTNDDPSGIRFINETKNTTSNNPFVVHTIRFDEILPLLEARGVRRALIKIDIETSESYMCETGLKVFERIDIPFVMMEWHHWRVNHQKRYQFIVDFFTRLNYVPTDEECKDLETDTWLTKWSGNVFWIKRIYRNESFC
ncbi:unnamed protein product [Rotaria sp. Silwood1]|nr:unnamed protein product [Rotaria sp. Silwood1]CAF1515222.1 unnamed protein product [Rotaria sp. Silwood1]CAF1526374.1 unnamed protein product [Rotaria sp. Silwood1]CAF3632133.1 unnamed protein product [Rotaria sp. Silwood1]CAF3669984.1 unnamed protein product [Rotaria sp. Silwood1]